MAAEGPGRQPDVDEEFARIVAGWGQVSPTSGSSLLAPPSAGAGPGEPPAQRLDSQGEAQPPGADPHEHPGADIARLDQSTGADATGADAHPTGAELGRCDPTEQAERGGSDDDAAHATVAPPEPGWRGYLSEEPEEHFQPPEPQLPPAHDATYWLAVLGLVAGPLIVLWAVVFSANADPGWSVLVGILVTVAGFGLLVLRGSGDHDPGDDGSRV